MLQAGCNCLRRQKNFSSNCSKSLLLAVPKLEHWQLQWNCSLEHMTAIKRYVCAMRNLYCSLKMYHFQEPSDVKADILGPVKGSYYSTFIQLSEDTIEINLRARVFINVKSGLQCPPR